MTHSWPDQLDLLATVGFVAMVLMLSGLGYVFMVLDVRAYLRSLKRGLILISRLSHGVPEWARQPTPRAIAVFGLRMPCSEDDLKRAYRSRVKRLHPDHGGDQRRFLLLQAHFEEALALLSERTSAADAPISTKAA